MTAQFSERLNWNGKNLSMCTEPLGFWLRSNGRKIRFGMSSTACWRGYIGSWEIINDRLYLVGIDASSEDGRPITLDDLFPGYSNGVFAHWVTREVRCPQGKMLDYVHMGYASTYEMDLYLTFSKGYLISKRLVTNGKGKDGDSEGYGVVAHSHFPISKGG
jgi:hypothetical protein